VAIEVLGGFATIATRVDNAGEVVGNCGGSDPQSDVGTYACPKHGVHDAARIDILAFGSAVRVGLGLNNRDQSVGLLSHDATGPGQGFMASPLVAGISGSVGGWLMDGPSISSTGNPGSAGLEWAIE
jgi:hypothetical protein